MRRKILHAGVQKKSLLSTHPDPPQELHQTHTQQGEIQGICTYENSTLECFPLDKSFNRAVSLCMVGAAFVTPRLSLWRSYAGFQYFVAANKTHQHVTRPARGKSWGCPYPAPRAVLARRAHDAAARSRLQPSIAPGIELIMGPMFSGKSTELLRRVEELEKAGLAVALVKSSKDNRYSQQQIVTHSGLTRVGSD